MRRFALGLVLLTACSGGEQTATVRATPAPPDTITKLRNELTAAIIASEASCSAAWLEKSVEPPCAKWPRRALTDPASAWMMNDATLVSLAAAAKREPASDAKALHARLLMERVLRDAPDAASLIALAKALKYTDTPALLSDLHGFDVRATTAVAARLLNASEGLYLVARTDVAVAAADVDELTAASLVGTSNPELARNLVDALRPGDAPTVSAIKDAHSTAVAPFFIAPSSQRIIVADVSGIEDLSAVTRAFARARTRTALGEADASMDLVSGFVASSVIGSADWLARASQIAEPALTRVVRVQAYRTIEATRAEAARAIDMLALYDGAPSISDASDPYMLSAVRFRARLVAAEVHSQLANRYGAAYWQSRDASQMLGKILETRSSETILQTLGHALSSDALLVASARALARSEPLVTLQ